MMKYLLIFIGLLCFNNFTFDQNQNISLKEMLQGYWQLKTDPNQIIFISNDTRKSIYKGKVGEKCRLRYNFIKSEIPFFNKEKQSFEFTDNYSDFKLEMIDSENDTTTELVLYVDGKNLELGYNAGIASFKKMKPSAVPHSSEYHDRAR